MLNLSSGRLNNNNDNSESNSILGDKTFFIIGASDLADSLRLLLELKNKGKDHRSL
jgi:hypothetical protein